MEVRRKLGATLAAALAAIGLAIVPSFAQTTSLSKLTFSLDFIPLGRHAPWYVAQGKGYFREEGLDVTIIPSQGSAHAVQTVDSRKADFGFVDVAGLVLARARGAKVKLVAINYQKAPYAIFSLTDGANVTRLEQLEGLSLGSGASSFTPSIIKGVMARNGLDPNKLKIVNAPPKNRASMLFSGKVPAIEFFVMAQPNLEARARRAKTGLSTLLLSDTSLDLYSNGIAVHEEMLRTMPEIVKKFVRAALKGWHYALNNPEEAVKLQRNFIAGLDEKVVSAELNIVKKLAVTPQTRANGLGSFDPKGMQSSLDFVVKYIGVPETPPAASDLYAEGFLPAIPIKP